MPAVPEVAAEEGFVKMDRRMGATREQLTWGGKSLLYTVAEESCVPGRVWTNAAMAISVGNSGNADRREVVGHGTGASAPQLLHERVLLVASFIRRARPPWVRNSFSESEVVTMPASVDHSTSGFVQSRLLRWCVFSHHWALGGSRRRWPHAKPRRRKEVRPGQVPRLLGLVPRRRRSVGVRHRARVTNTSADTFGDGDHRAACSASQACPRSCAER